MRILANDGISQKGYNALKEKGNIVGYIGFSKENEKYYFNIIIHPKYRGKKYGYKSNGIIQTLEYILNRTK